MPREGILFILVGPSGAGKNTLMRRVQEQLGDLPQLATFTTRDIRPGEQEGREHVFVTPELFHDMIDDNAFVEWQQVHMTDLYGTPRQTINDALESGRDLIADIDFLGAQALLKVYAENAVLIFVTPSDLDILAKRIIGRGNITPEAVADRLERARFEMTFAPHCDYLILNDIVEPAAESLRQIVISERLRRRNIPIPGGVIIPRHTFHLTVTALILHGDHLLVHADTSESLLPSFRIKDQNEPPHEVLQREIQHSLGQQVHIESFLDTRFDFVAPNHVSVAIEPPDVYLDFYYKCSLEDQSLVSAEWKWQPLAVLSLPPAINELVAMQN